MTVYLYDELNPVCITDYLIKMKKYEKELDMQEGKRNIGSWLNQE